MKKYRIGFISIISIFFALGPFLSTWGETQREEETGYKKQVEEKLEVLDKEINELKDKGTDLKEEAKEEFNKGMTELQKKQRAVKKQWKEIQHTTATQWKKVKTTMDGATRDLKSAYDNLLSRLKEGNNEN